MENKNKYNNSKKKNMTGGGATAGYRGASGAKQSFRTDGKQSFGMSKQGGQSRSRVLSLTQLLSRIRKQRGSLPLGSNAVKNTGTNSLQANDLMSSSSGLLSMSTERTGTGSVPAGRTPAFNMLDSISLPGSSVKNNLSTGTQSDQNQRTRNLPSKQSQLSRSSVRPFRSSTPDGLGRKGEKEEGIKDQKISSFNPNLSRGTRNSFFSFSASDPQRGKEKRGTGMGNERTEREEQKRQKPIKPIIPPKSLVIILKEKPEKILYNRRIIDYKHCGLLQRYIGLGGKILPRRQTRLTAKQQRYIAKTIKSARIMGLLPFVSKEKGFFR